MTPAQNTTAYIQGFEDGKRVAKAEFEREWKALAQPEQEPEFIKHEVENAEDWSEWVCPNPHKYLMKCCDCGLVHEAQFGVVRYKSEEEREACDFVDDFNMQAVFRMRRSEQWSPEDTAHRAGGLPMEQPEQRSVSEHLEPVAWITQGGKGWLRWHKSYDDNKDSVPLYTTPPQRKPLTDEQIDREALKQEGTKLGWHRRFARAIEAAHGIKGEA